MAMHLFLSSRNLVCFSIFEPSSSLGNINSVSNPSFNTDYAWSRCADPLTLLCRRRKMITVPSDKPFSSTVSLLNYVWRQALLKFQVRISCMTSHSASIARNCINSQVMKPARFVQRSPAVTIFFLNFDLIRPCLTFQMRVNMEWAKREVHNT